MAGPKEDNVLYVRAYCKGYACARCGPRKGRYVRKLIAQYAAENALQRLVTLTLDPKKLRYGASQKERVQYIRECWRKMSIYLKRKLGRSIVFIAVLEFQKNGNPHLHVLVNSYLPNAWLSHAWRSVGGGFTDIRFVDLHRVSAYLSKYMTKAWLDDFPEGCRRITASRGVVFFARKESSKGWQLMRAPIKWILSVIQAHSIPVYSETYELEEGDSRLSAFEAADEVSCGPCRFKQSNRWIEERFIRSTGRKTVGAGVKFSPATGSLVSYPRHLEYV